jgi:hypothetical protein
MTAKVWKTGRGLLGPLTPLLGDWRATAQMKGQAFECRRSFQRLGKGWIRLDAAWDVPNGPYLETALYGPGDDGELAMFSFTSDGRRSMGRRTDGADVDPQALAFKARMPAGVARMVYWPLEDGEPGFRFAVENQVKAGWNRFLTQVYRPAA